MRNSIIKYFQRNFIDIEDQHLLYFTLVFVYFPHWGHIDLKVFKYDFIRLGSFSTYPVLTDVWKPTLMKIGFSTWSQEVWSHTVLPVATFRGGAETGKSGDLDGQGQFAWRHLTECLGAALPASRPDTGMEFGPSLLGTHLSEVTGLVMGTALLPSWDQIFHHNWSNV